MQELLVKKQTNNSIPSTHSATEAENNIQKTHARALSHRLNQIDLIFAKVNPIAELAQLYAETPRNEKTINTRLAILTQLCKYYTPELKSVEVKSEGNAPMQINIQTFYSKE